MEKRDREWHRPYRAKKHHYFPAGNPEPVSLCGAQEAWLVYKRIDYISDDRLPDRYKCKKCQARLEARANAQ